MKKKLIFPLILFLVILFSNVAYAGHWTAPMSSPTIMHTAGLLAIDGADAQLNDEVAVFDSTGVLIGLFVVTESGQNLYGDLVINGDSPLTADVDEGADTGETLFFKVWSAAKSREYSGSEINTVGVKMGTYLAATIPFKFSGNFYGVNITATATPKSNQTIGAISFNPTSVSLNGTTTVSATANSTLPVTFTSTTPSVCTVSGSTVTALTTGTCTIAANQAGNDTYNAALQVTASITPNKLTQTIGAVGFLPSTVSVNGTTSVSATASSGLGVTFTSATPSVCSVSGSTVTALTSGTCTIAADQAGNSTYSAAPQVTGAITPSKLTQTIGSISFAPTTVAVNGTTTASATATSGLGVTFSSSTPSVCTVSGSTVTALTSGTCTIAADQTGNGTYSAATQVTANITPSKLSQTIGSISFAPSTIVVNGTTTASATATSALGVTFSSTTPAVCTVSGSTVTALTTGTCTIAADQAGNGTFNSASQVTANIVVGKQSQTIGSISFAPTTVAVNGTTTASATATSGLGVTFSSLTPTACTVSGTTVTALTTGTCTIAADQAGNGSYSAATQVTASLTPGKQSQSIGSISFTPSTVSIGGTTTVSATATSGLGVSFGSTTPSVCTVSGTTVTALTNGTCTIAADQAGNGSFGQATQVTGSITSSKLSQTIGTIIFTPSTVIIGGTTAVSTTATSSLGVTFSSTTPAVCTVSGTTVTALTTGTCTIAANQAGNGTYSAAAQVTGSINPGKQSQTIGSISFTPSTVAVNGTTTASATATSGLGVTFNSTTPTVCTVSGSTVTALTTGTCSIAADQAGNSTFNSASQVTANIIVGKQSQTIGSISFAPATVAVNGTTTASATATSGLGVTFSSLTPTACTVSGSTVTALTTGTCTIAADQAGNGSYSAATQVTASLTPGKQSQSIGSISFAPATVSVTGTTTVSATATSSLGVTFSSTTPSVCTVSGSTVTALTTGTCTIAADQAGNSNFGPASQVTGSITPSKLSQTIGAITFTPSTVSINGTTTVSTTATSSLGVAFSSTTPTVCTVSGTTVTALTTGACTIAANQDGNGTYAAAPQVTGTITPVKLGQTIGAISFAPATVNVGGTTTASAAATSTLGVTFSSTTPTVCTVSGAAVTALTTGSCIIAANQAGDATYNAASQVTATITPAATVPGVPANVTAVPGDRKATVSFTQPTFTGGDTITGYTVTSIPGNFTATGTSSPIVITGLSNGTLYQFTVKATNSKGDSNLSTASGSVILNLLTPTVGDPSTTVAKSGTTVTYKVDYVGAETITLAASDVTINKSANVTASVAVSGDGTSFRTVTITNITGDGTLGITINAGTATASGGSITAAASSASGTFIVDNTLPALTVKTLANNVSTSSNTLTITGTASDANGVQTVTVNGTSAQLTAGAFNTSVPLNAGSNTITVVAVDGAGNQSTDVRTVIYDNVLPKITFSASTPTDQSFTRQQVVTIDGTVSKAGTVAITVNANEPILVNTTGNQNSFTTTVTLATGINHISITASDTDTPPNSSTEPRTVTYDSQAPAVAIIDPAQAITTTFKSYLIKGAVSDNFTGTTLAVVVNDVPLSPAPTIGAEGAFQQTVTFTENTTYHIAVTATDLAGNSTTVQRNIIYQPFTIADALRALQIASGIVTAGSADLQKLDVGPLTNGKLVKDNVVDLSDTIILLRLVVGDLDGLSW